MNDDQTEGRIAGKPPVVDHDLTEPWESGGNVSGALVRGLAATVVFVAAAISLTAIGYLYGALLEIRAEFPFILTLSFVLGAAVVIVVFPLVGWLANRAELSLVNSRTAKAVGAGFGASSMAIVWLVTAGPGKDPYDWPELLYLLQLVLSGVAAGVVLFSSLDYSADSVRRGSWVFLALTVSFLLAISVPYLLLWQARNEFNTEAADQAAIYFRMPDGFSLAVKDESSSIGSLERNIRYRCSGTMDEGGRNFSVDIIGERSVYEVDIREIHASLSVPAPEISAQAEWDDSEEGRRAQRAVLSLAGDYVNSPLQISSVKGNEVSGKSIFMRGDGLEVVARPGETSPEGQGLQFAFKVTAASF